MGLEKLDELINKYIRELDEEYKNLVAGELERYSKELVDKRIKALEPLRQKIIKLFQA
ncbi:hypothetical protein PYJP_16290 [Pyrofollis japonicus]|uniref:hypothetical protein n=1 Tax=Pyrofollis japonicus TaxID=3060460 RepID=UPI00295B4BE3|nr:hypothetical protein [Pyrofollis japonicus]BEP18277.1 hypothetical protein PYJP_16290 [Pyrofollis japonicus]